MTDNMMNKRGLYAFIKRLYNKRIESIWVCIVGRNQTGKTNLALRMFEMLYDLKLADGFGANIKVEADFEIDFIQDFETLERRCKMLNPNPAKHGLKRYMYFGSEMAKWVPKDTPWSETTRELIQKLQTVRKFGLNFIGDGIDRIDDRILNEMFFRGKFIKPSKLRPQIATWIDFENNERIPLKGIPKTGIKFDTYADAMFYMRPQVPENAIVPLNESHKIVKVYRETGSWKKAGVTTQQGKRELFKVLDYHFTHCLPHVQEEVIEDIELVTADTI